MISAIASPPWALAGPRRTNHPPSSAGTSWTPIVTIPGPSTVMSVRLASFRSSSLGTPAPVATMMPFDGPWFGQLTNAKARHDFWLQGTVPLPVPLPGLSLSSSNRQMAWMEDCHRRRSVTRTERSLTGKKKLLVPYEKTQKPGSACLHEGMQPYHHAMPSMPSMPSMPPMPSTHS